MDNIWLGEQCFINTISSFSYFSMETYVVGTQKNRLNERVF